MEHGYNMWYQWISLNKILSKGFFVQKWPIHHPLEVILPLCQLMHHLTVVPRSTIWLRYLTVPQSSLQRQMGFIHPHCRCASGVICFGPTINWWRPQHVHDWLISPHGCVLYHFNCIYSHIISMSALYMIARTTTLLLNWTMSLILGDQARGGECNGPLPY